MDNERLQGIARGLLGGAAASLVVIGGMHGALEHSENLGVKTAITNRARGECLKGGFIRPGTVKDVDANNTHIESRLARVISPLLQSKEIHAVCTTSADQCWNTFSEGDKIDTKNVCKGQD